jgi:hypothetical protein
MTVTIESEPTGKQAFTLWPPGTQVRGLLRVAAWHGRGRLRVASRLSEDLDPALWLVEVKHVPGTGQRDQPRLGQQTPDEPNGPRKRRAT